MATVQSIERAFALLEFLSDKPKGVKITSLASETGLSKSTVHRLLSTLIELNYVKQNKETDEYQLSYKTLYLTRNILRSSPLIETSKPLLTKLGEQINETIHLCVEDEEQILYIDKIESNQRILMFSRIGSKAPMYCTGIGKMILSGKKDKDLYEIIDRINFIPRTKNTFTNKKDFLAEIEAIRQRGYALDDIENEEGIRCIAAPVFDYTGEIIASFSISGPISRITYERIDQEIAEAILNTAYDLSLQLGYVGTAFSNYSSFKK